MPTTAHTARTGVHINDCPADDPTRLLVHYDGRFWPVIIAAAFFAASLGYVAGLLSGTDHYTMSPVCDTGDDQ